MDGKAIPLMDALLSFFWFVVGSVIVVAIFLVIAWIVAMVLQFLLG